MFDRDSLFRLRGTLSKRQEVILAVLGFVILVSIWTGLSELLSNEKAIYDIPAQSEQLSIDSLSKAQQEPVGYTKTYPILPPPWKVVASFGSLITEDALLSNALKSIWLNVQGYFWAIIISLPIGFLIGLMPLARGLFSKPVDAMRYLPLTALTGLFIVWFGIEDRMKVAFLAFGIIVYLLPVVVQRIWQVSDVYLKTVFTLGAGDWQVIKSVYIPAVMSRLFDDIRVLTAISWTYIIIAELVNRAGGIGSLIYIKARQGQIEKVFAILFVIIIIGLLQDQIFRFMGRRLFPHKHFNTFFPGIAEARYGIYTLLLGIMLVILVGMIIPISLGTQSMFLLIAIISATIFTLYGEFKIRKHISM